MAKKPKSKPKINKVGKTPKPRSGKKPHDRVRGK